MYGWKNSQGFQPRKHPPVKLVVLDFDETLTMATFMPRSKAITTKASGSLREPPAMVRFGNPHGWAHFLCEKPRFVWSLGWLESSGSRVQGPGNAVDRSIKFDRDVPTRGSQGCFILWPCFGTLVFHREIRWLTVVIRKTRLSQGNQLTFENQIWFRNDILKGFFIDKLRLAFFAQHLCLGPLRRLGKSPWTLLLKHRPVPNSFWFPYVTMPAAVQNSWGLESGGPCEVQLRESLGWWKPSGETPRAFWHLTPKR